MTETVEARPEFRSLADDAVVASLQGLDPENPITAEVVRLIHAYTSNFQAHIQRLGRIPPDILRTKPRWPIEAVAMRLTTEVIRETLAPPTSPEKT